jgi:spermidine synthase
MEPAAVSAGQAVPAASKAVLVAALCAGAASVVGQVALLRDLLTLFSGFEPAAGLTLAAWLLWTGLGVRLSARVLAARPQFAGRVLAWLLLVWALALPASILAIRAARPVLGVALGEMPGPGNMLAVAVAAPAALCLVSGMVFSACWALVSSAGDPRGGVRPARPMRVYAAEAAGSALGGVALYFAVIPALTVLAGTLCLGLLMALLSGWLRQRLAPDDRRAFVLAWSAAVMALALGTVLSGTLERVSRSWQWGPELIESADSPYQNLAVTRRAGQLSFFGGGVWLFSAGDAQSAQFAVHLPMLMHPGTRDILILGGDVFGLSAEIFQYPDVDRIDAVEPDTRLFPLVASNLPAEAARLAADGRVRLLHEDAAAFVRGAARAYDLILMQAPEPVSAQANRFYTVEFFTAARRALRPGGLLAFGLPSSPEGAGLAQGRLLSSIWSTLAAVFPQVLVLPGDTARFFASESADSITADMDVFERRRAALGVKTRFVRDYYLIDLLNPFQIDRFAAMLGRGVAPKLNRDFVPTCYLDGLVLASTGVHQVFRSLFLAVGELTSAQVYIACAVLLLGATALGRGRGLAAGTGAAVFCAGFASMSLELVLLIAFQVLEGSLYGSLALLVAAYMAGLGLGAALGETQRVQAAASGRFPFFFVSVQAVLAVVVVVVPDLCLGAAGLAGTAGVPKSAAFALLMALCGALGGLHFSVAVRAAAGETHPGAHPAGRLYALDLAGAAVGSLATGFVLVPVLGLGVASGAAGLICLAGAAAVTGAGWGERKATSRA